MGSILGCDIANKLGKYLGVFVDDRREKKRNFDVIVSKIDRRMSGWKVKLLSQASRMVLIKSVLTVDSVYNFSLIQAPRYVTDKIDNIVTNFFWGFNGDSSRIHLSQSALLFHPRSQGGLGFRKATHVNKALLTKLPWRLISRPNSLPSRWICSKYILPHTKLDYKKTS